MEKWEQIESLMKMKKDALVFFHKKLLKRENPSERLSKFYLAFAIQNLLIGTTEEERRKEIDDSCDCLFLGKAFR